MPFPIPQRPNFPVAPAGVPQMTPQPMPQGPPGMQPGMPAPAQPSFPPLQALGMDPQRAIAQAQAAKAQAVNDAMNGQIVNPVPGAMNDSVTARSNALTAGAPSPGGVPIAPNAPQPNDPSALYRGLPSRRPQYQSFPPVRM
jgi:hypothetical protein